LLLKNEESVISDCTLSVSGAKSPWTDGECLWMFLLTIVSHSLECWILQQTRIETMSQNIVSKNILICNQFTIFVLFIFSKKMWKIGLWHCSLLLIQILFVSDIKISDAIFFFMVPLGFSDADIWRKTLRTFLFLGVLMQTCCVI